MSIDKIAKDRMRERSVGLSFHSTENRLYRIWSSMKTRCYNPNFPEYVHYGARGIEVCDEWHEFDAFADWAVSNGYRDDLTIERVDVNGIYCPDNCTWADYTAQANNKTNNRRITFNGKTLTSRQWDRELGYRDGVISDRLNTLGWDLERAMSEPVGASHAATFTFDGETHTIREWTQILGITKSSLWRRIKTMPLDKALSKPKKGETNLLTYEGRTLSMQAWAEEKGMKLDTLWKRIHESGWSVEKALTTPVRHYNKREG